MNGPRLTQAEGMQTTAPAAHSLADLPDAALACIMQHVPLRQRLSRCALVCRSWAAAAATVPAHVVLNLSGAAGPAKCRQLQSWLGACRQQVVSLKVHALPGAQLQLPGHRLCQLESLDLKGIQVGLQQYDASTGSMGDVAGAAAGSSGSSSGGFPGVASSAAAAAAAATAAGASTGVLPKLRQLHMTECDMCERLLSQFSQATGLTQLHLRLVQVCSADLQNRLDSAQRAAAFTRLLQHTTGLRDLHLAHMPCAVAAVLQQASAMQHLQHLSFQPASKTDAAALATLPISLTGLDIAPSFTGCWLGLSAASQLSRLTSLQQLRTAHLTVHPEACSSLTWLRNLHIQRPYSLSGLVDSTQAAALLQALACLTQLQHLELRDCCLHKVQPSEGEAACYQCFSALTASSQLTALSLSQDDRPPLPEPAAVDCMFPAGRVLPHLARLHLECWSGYTSKPCVGSAQVASIARACPALQQLVLQNATPQDFDSACLDQLPPGVQVNLVALPDWRQAFHS